MRVYVAGKTHDYEIVREVQAAVKAHGHTITHDWTAAVETHGPANDREPLTGSQARMYAIDDFEGVVTADHVLVVPHENWCGTLLEIGAALTHDIRVTILGTPHQRCVFWAHPLCGRTLHEWPDCWYEALYLVDKWLIGPRVNVNGRQ